MAEGQEKTEDPTPRRRAEAREQGQIARSTDLNSAAMLLIGLVLLYLLGMKLLTAMRNTVELTLSGGFQTNNARLDGMQTTIAYARELLTWSMLPYLLLLFACGLIVVLLQVGLLLTLKPLEPNISKLSPAKGIKNIFSLKGLMRFAMSMLKVTLVGSVATWLIVVDLPKVAALAGLGAAMGFIEGGNLVFWFALKLALLLLVLGLIDYAYQKWQHEQDLKMSKQEVDDEMKRMEGDPQVKRRRAQVARRLAMQRLQSDVPKADVVVTNPTHVSVALRYRGGEMGAPRVVAKGADFMALRIRQIAALHGVPLVEKPPLARSIFAACEVGDEVRPEHYAAVAEVLAYVYRLNDTRPGVPNDSDNNANRRADRDAPRAAAMS